MNLIYLRPSTLIRGGQSGDRSPRKAEVLIFLSPLLPSYPHFHSHVLSQSLSKCSADMTGSALMGEPPATHKDALIYKGFVIINGTDYFTLPSESLLANMPPNDFKGRPMIAAAIVLIILVILLTGARVWAQQYLRRQHISFLISNIFMLCAAVRLSILLTLCGGNRTTPIPKQKILRNTCLLDDNLSL